MSLQKKFAPLLSYAFFILCQEMQSKTKQNQKQT